MVVVVRCSGVLDIPSQGLRPVEEFPGLHVNPIGLASMLFLLTERCWRVGEADARRRQTRMQIQMQMQMTGYGHANTSIIKQARRVQDDDRGSESPASRGGREGAG